MLPFPRMPWQMAAIMGRRRSPRPMIRSEDIQWADAPPTNQPSAPTYQRVADPCPVDPGQRLITLAAKQMAEPRQRKSPEAKTYSPGEQPLKMWPPYSAVTWAAMIGPMNPSPRDMTGQADRPKSNGTVAKSAVVTTWPRRGSSPSVDWSPADSPVRKKTLEAARASLEVTLLMGLWRATLQRAQSPQASIRRVRQTVVAMTQEVYPKAVRTLLVDRMSQTRPLRLAWTSCVQPAPFSTFSSPISVI